MKRLLFLLFLGGLLFCSPGCATALNGMRTQSVTWEELGDDAAFKRFKRESASKQIVTLNSLLDRAEEESLNARTIEDVNDLKEKVEIINDYISHSKAKKL